MIKVEQINLEAISRGVMVSAAKTLYGSFAGLDEVPLNSYLPRNSKWDLICNKSLFRYN